jgi:hypothetical protein
MTTKPELPISSRRRSPTSIAELERYIAELSTYAAKDPDRSPALRLAVNNSEGRP